MPLRIEEFAAETIVQGSSLLASSLGERLARIQERGTSSQRLLAEFVLRNPIRAAALSIEDLSRVTGLSTATLSRFAREIGFEGYADMRGSIAEAMQTVLDPVEKIRRRLQSEKGKAGSAELLDAVRTPLAGLDGIALDRQTRQVAGMIARARKVYVVGFGISAHIAAILTLGLEPYHRDVISVMEYGGTEVGAGRLMRIGSDDLMLAITFPRYSNEIQRLCRLANDRRSQIVVLTDSYASPIATLADEVLLATAAHPLLPSSMVSALAIVELIVSRVILADPCNADNATRLTEAMDGFLLRPEL
jgi:DNA-binding MurR/RpiR family transcriptional regulator